MSETTPRAEVLIVDDTPANLAVLSSILGAAGYQVRPAISGETALRAVARRAPALVLLDVRMPEMDGYEVCRRLKADPAAREIPVVFVSAADDPGEKQQAFAAGAADYLTKPFEAAEVLARVATQVALVRQERVLAGLRAPVDDLLAEVAALEILLDGEGESSTVAASLTRLREQANLLRGLLAD